MPQYRLLKVISRGWTITVESKHKNKHNSLSTYVRPSRSRQLVQRLLLVNTIHLSKLQCPMHILTISWTVHFRQKVLWYATTMIVMALKVCSFNCRGLKKSSVGLLALAQLFDIICLQETWLTNYELNILVTDEYAQKMAIEFCS